MLESFFWILAVLTLLALIALGIYILIRIFAVVAGSLLDLVRRMLGMQHSEVMIGSMPLKKTRRYRR